MNLDEFISSSISQIVSGVVAAQKNVAKLGARVNPAGAVIGKSVLETTLHDKKTNAIVEVIEFDLSIKVEKAKKTKGTIGIVIASIGLGSQGESSGLNSEQNRIRFRVPVQLPQAD